MLNILNLLVNECPELLIRSGWHLVPGLLEHLFPHGLLIVFLLPELIVDRNCYFLRLDVLESIDTINCSLFSVYILQNIVGCSRCLVEQEGPLNLVLPLFVSWRSCFVADIPAVVVYIASIATSISRLWLRLRIGLISKALLDHELLVAFL